MKEALIACAVRMMFHDSQSFAAFQFRMPAGFPGDVNRTHPFSVEPCLIDDDDPPTIYGQPVLADTAENSVRQYKASDQSDSVVSNPYGFLVRPYPTQQSSTNNFGAAAFGSATPPTAGVDDVLRSGYIMAQLNIVGATTTKGGRVYVWAAATSGDHIQGGIEIEASGGDTTLLSDNVLFNGPADGNGVVEISVRP